MSVFRGSRRGTILGPDLTSPGKVRVKLDRQSDTNSVEYSVSIPAAYASPTGGFVGGYPVRGTPVWVDKVTGEWKISGYVKPDNTYPNTNTSGEAGVAGNTMADLGEDRVLIQSSGAANRIYLHPTDGINLGNQTSNLHIDTTRDVITHDFAQEMGFTEGTRRITGRIKRDIRPSILRGKEYSMLYDSAYNDSLDDISMNPSSEVSFMNSDSAIRNLPLAESREIVYEFASSDTQLDFRTDKEEAALYASKGNIEPISYNLKTGSRAYAFGLSLHTPNHLIETVRGTGVDALGNLIDLNRSVLPIGREEACSFGEESDSEEIFRKTRALNRRALAYHFEINVRKANVNYGADDAIFEVPSINSKANHARVRSRFFIDVDKEGQFKINVPASSETGNLPLLTRYETASTMLAEQNGTDDYNKFIIEDQNNIDIYLDDHANHSTIPLRRTDGGQQVGVKDRIDDALISYGTAYHDITKSGWQFTKDRLEQDEGGLLVRYIEESDINQRQDEIQYDKILEPFIFAEGTPIDSSEAVPFAQPDAEPLDELQRPNAGGRSGMINLDGFISVNVGANTIDRQSMWLDCAGGVVSSIGRDRRGISYCATLDGDMLIQVGGNGVGTGNDNRFKNENDGFRGGTFDLRVMTKGQGTSPSGMTILRIDSKGLTIAAMGRCEIASQQAMLFRSNTKILFEAPYIAFFPDGSDAESTNVLRAVKRSGTDI